MKKEAVEAGHQFAPIIRPDIQNPSARKGNSSSNIKNFPQVTPQQVQSISIQQARRIQLRALGWINWWQSSNSMDDGKRCVCTFFFFSNFFSHTGKSESHVIDGRCQQHTAPHKLCSRNIFSRVAQDRATGSRLSPRLNVRQTVCPFARIVCRSRASCLTRTRHCWIFHLFSHPQLFPSVLLPSRGGHPPPDPRTAGLFARLVMQSPVTKTSWRPINGVSTTQ